VWGVRYVAAGAAAAVGLPAAAGFAVIPAVVVGIWLWRRQATPRPSLLTPRAVGLLTTLVVAVVATGAARATNTPPATSRYLYFPAIVMILLACEWTAGLSVGRRRLAVGLGVATVLLAAVLGVHQLRNGKVFFLNAADATAARMGAMRLVGGPKLVIEPDGLGYTPALLAEFVAVSAAGRSIQRARSSQRFRPREPMSTTCLPRPRFALGSHRAPAGSHPAPESSRTPARPW
jgi:hypothetical protein